MIKEIQHLVCSHCISILKPLVSHSVLEIKIQACFKEESWTAPLDFLKPPLLKQRKIQLHFVFSSQEWSGHKAEWCF